MFQPPPSSTPSLFLSLRNISPRKPKQLIPLLGRGRVPGAERLDLGLGVQAGRLGRRVGLADVGQLVADAVGDDVGVERLLLALGDERVLGLEGELGRLAVGAPAHEAHGRHAEAKVGAGEGGLLDAVVVAVAVAVTVAGVVVTVTVVTVVAIFIAVVTVVTVVSVTVVTVVAITVVSVVSVVVVTVVTVVAIVVVISVVAVVGRGSGSDRLDDGGQSPDLTAPDLGGSAGGSRSSGSDSGGNGTSVAVSIAVVAIAVVAVVPIVVVIVVTASSRLSSAAGALSSEAGESLGSQEIRNTQPIGI